MKNTWFHGTIYDFEQFDLNELGKSSNSRDAELGFYFGKNKRTAEAYIESGQSINEENFKEKYKMSIEEVKSKIHKLENDFESKYDISYNEAKNSYSKQFKLKREFEDFRSDFEILSNHYNVIDPYSYEEESPIVNYYLLGNIFEVEIKNDNFFHYDMENQSWDETKQTQIAREARNNGYNGVVFENMQDSGWFGGNGIDDILLKFDVNDISLKGIHEYREEGITFNKSFLNKSESKIKP